MPNDAAAKGPLAALARFAVRHRRAVLAGCLVLFAVAGTFGGSVQKHLSQGGFEDPGSESARASQILDAEFGAGPPNIFLLVDARGADVDAAPVAAQGVALTRQLAAEDSVSEAVSYWTLGNAQPLKSSDGDQALVLGRVSGDQDEVIEHVEDLSKRYTREEGTITVRVGGDAETSREIAEVIERDTVKAEAIALPITLLLLIVVFGSVVSALLPVVIGAFTIVATFLILRLVNSLTEVSVHSLSMTTAMGLALAIDYSLFMVSRYREELARGLGTPEAISRTVQTAGRTVAFGGVTVAVSLAVLAIFPLAFLRSFAYAGIAVVAFAVFGALVALPAALAVLGPRIDRLSWRRSRGPRDQQRQGRWHAIAVFVMRRPVPIALVVTAILLLLGAPFLGARFGSLDDRVLPAGSPVRAVHDEVRESFPAEDAGALSVVAPRTGQPAARRDEIVEYATRLSKVEGVARVDSAFGVFARGQQASPAAPALSERFARAEGTWLSVVPSIEPISPQAEQLVKNVRAADAPFPVLVAGRSAELVDSKAALFERIPLAAALIVAISLVCLFLMFGSVLVSVKAVVLNGLSLTATFGAMVWIFQEGHLSGFLGFTPTGFLDMAIPILMFCGAYGLSMDYEVFLMSRIKEEHDSGADNATSVAVGLEKTGRIVTAAAALMAIVFIAFAASGISFIKMFGIGMALAVIMDATLIRAALVPAFMRLAGNANWWAPPFLQRVHERWGIPEAPVQPGPELREMTSVR